MLFFIIVTYNSSNYIRRCIESIMEFESNSKIIIVDNNSKDDTVQIIKNYSGITLFTNKNNLGFGSANNIGIEYAVQQKAEYIFLLNHDAYLVEPIVSKSIEIFDNNPEFGILTPFQVQANCKSLEINFNRFLSWDGVLGKMVNDVFLNGIRKNVYEVPFAQAASWIIKAKVIEKVGYFNPLFFHYGEDNEYLNRLKYHSFKIGVMSNSRIVHLANPLNMNHKKNYNSYHRNRIYNNWLIEQLDININFNVKSWLISIFPFFKTLLISIFSLRLLRACRQILLILRIFKVSFSISSSRNLNRN